MLLSQFIRESTSALGALYGPREAAGIVSSLCGELLGVSSYAHIVEPGLEVSAEALPVLQRAMERLCEGEPLQYVTGVQEFCGRRFKVRPGVLIPRPETEELVATAAERLRGGGRVLDLCTGSGCIAWSLALDCPEAKVTGVDISDEALAVAREQFSAEGASGTDGPSLRSSLPLRSACGPLPSLRDISTPCSPPGDIFPKGWSRAATGPSVPEAPSEEERPTFVKQDVLQVPESFEGAPFDVITANPPYIRESEKALMHTNVLKFEPSLALFVPDSDPLVFYRAIALWAVRFLAPGGFGIVEINEALGAECAALFENAGLANVKIQSDFRQKERFVSFLK